MATDSEIVKDAIKLTDYMVEFYIRMKLQDVEIGAVTITNFNAWDTHKKEFQELMNHSRFFENGSVVTECSCEEYSNEDQLNIVRKAKRVLGLSE